MPSWMSWAFAFVFLASTGLVACEKKAGEQALETAAVAGKCEHGVQANLCTRCNPKLESAFKAEGDWCDEHKRPESQCAVCNPELAKAGIKP